MGFYLRHHYGWVIAATGFLVTMSTLGAGRHLYPLVLPNMKDTLGLGYGPAGALASATMVGYLAFSALGGVLATRHSPRLIISLSTAVTGLSMLSLGLTPWYPLAFLLMLALGMGVGGAFIPTAGLVTTWFPPRRRGLFMALTSMGANVGILSTALFVPRILLAYGSGGWRYAWVYFGAGTLIIALVGCLGLRDRPQPKDGGESNSRASAARPSWVAVFRNRAMLQLTLAYFLLGFFSVYTVFIVAFVTRELGYSTSFAGSLWFLLSLFASITMVFWGYLSDLAGRKAALLPSSAILFVSILLPVFGQEASYLYASVILFGATFLGAALIMVTAAGDMVEPGLASAAMGVATLGHGLGQMTGPFIGGILIDAFRSFYPGFLLAALAIFLEVAIIATLPLPRPRTS